MSYFIEHNIEEEEHKRPSKSNQNPDVSTLFSPVAVQQHVMAVASLFGAIREQHADGNNDQIDALISQLLEEAQSQAKGTPPASKAFISNLERLMATSANMSCSVCLESLASIDASHIVIHRLPCSHVFHKDCILPWLQIHNTCPMCRMEFETDDPEYEKKRKGIKEDSEEEWDPFYG